MFGPQSENRMIDAHSPAWWRATAALCLGSFMIFANVYVTQPLLPMLTDHFGVSSLQASWSFTLTTLMLGASLLFYGPLSDAIGRRGIMLATMVGATLVALLLSQITGFYELLILRAFQGFLLGGLPAIAIAYMGDEFQKPALMLAVGYYISANSLGGISGRLLGGFIGDYYGWQQAFTVVCGISVVCIALFWWLLLPSRHFQARSLRPKPMIRDLTGHLRNPALMMAYMIGGLNFFIFVNQYSYATFLLAAPPYNLSPSWLGMLFLTYLSGTVGSALSGKAAKHWSQPACMAAGGLLLIIGTLVTLIPDVKGILAGFLINAFGFFFAHSSASSWVSQNAVGARASASSLYLVFYYLGASTGGIYLELFWLQSGWKGVVLGSILVLFVTTFIALLLRCRQHRMLVAS